MSPNATSSNASPSAPGPNPERGHRWVRRFAWVVGGLALVWALTWLGVPPLLKWQFQKQASAYLGRTVTLDRVDFKPWSLELTLSGLRVADAAGTGEQLSLASLYIDAELQSLVRLAPVIDAVRLQGPRLSLRHLGQGRYDVDDVLQRLQPDPQASDSEPARFALFNMELADGEVQFQDDAVGATHQLQKLHLSVPFLSNLPSRREIVTRPRLAFELNGSAFDTQWASTPFAQSHHTDVTLDIPTLDLAPYLPYWPERWPVRPQAGELQLALKLAFEDHDTPSVTLSGAVAVNGLRVAQRLGEDTKDWLAWERLELAMTRVEPLARRVDLEHITLKGPRLALSRDAQGRLNLQRLAEAFTPARQAVDTASASQAPATGAPWSVRVGRLQLDAGRIDWADATTRPAAALALSDLALQVGEVAWPLQKPVPISLSAKLGDTPLNATGQASDTEAGLQVSLGEWPLGMAAPYLAGVLEPAVDGRLRGSFRLDWRAAREGQPMALGLSSIGLDLQNLRVGTAKRPLAQWTSLQVKDGRLDLVGRRVELGSVALGGLNAAVERDATGRWMFERWLKTPPVQAAGKGAPAQAGGEPWSVKVGAVSLDNARIAFGDRQPARPVGLTVSQLSLQLKDVQPLAARQPDMPLKLQARVAATGAARADAGRLSINGTLRLPAAQAGLRLRSRIQADHLPLHALEPYFGDRLNLDLLRADASYRGTADIALASAGLTLSLAGDAALDDLRASTLTPSEDLLAWKSLQVRGIQLKTAPGEALRLAVAETVLSDYFARVIIDETGRINLQDLVKPAPEAPAAGPAAVTPVAAAPPPDIRFGPVSLINGRALFSDRFIQPNYSANLSELTGGLSAFASAAPGAGEPPAMAELNLRGRAEGTAALEITGRINPLARPLALDVKGRVRDLELPPLSPYSVKYAGYGIQRGKLSVDVAYRIEPGGQLTASNQIILNQLSFGDRVEGSNAPNLPVKLAVALLADRHGVIDINLPISGSLNDPQFRLGPLIVRLIVNLIGKALISPFSLIASAFSGGGEEMSQVAFEPGRSVLTAPMLARLESVAKALTDRPALQLTVVGQSDLETERSGYQRARLDEMVRAEKRRALARAGGSVPDTVTVTAEEYPELLRQVYRRADIPKPRNLIGLAKDIPLAEMESLLMASVPVNENAMRELAVARAVAVKDQLTARGLPEDRLFLGAPVVQRKGDNWQPQAELQLAPR